MPSQAPQVDESAPHTTIAVRLASGQRIRCKLNHSHTVGDLRAAINAQTGSSPAAYELVSTFPRGSYNDNAKTISDAGLIGAALLQKAL